MSNSYHERSRGYTLIEIVMLLVLLGILAAVAVPKYFDLQEQAQEQAAKAVIAEAQSRMNALFTQHLLSGGSCQRFLDKASDVGVAILLGQNGFEKQGALGTIPLAQGSMSAYFADNKIEPPTITFRVYFNDQYTEVNGYRDGKVYFPSCHATE